MPWQVYNSAGQLLQATDLPDNAVTNAKVADDAIGVAELSATGTASSSVFLRGDNAWAAPGGGPSQATQSAIEAETNEDTYVPPDLMKHHPGVAKVWCQIQGNNTLRSPDYNVASVTSTGTGNRTIVYTVDFSTSVYSVVGAMNQGDSTGDHETWDTFAVGSVRNLVRNASGLVAQETGMAAFGDQ